MKPGDVITGRKQLAESVGMTEQQVRTILNRLKSTNEITIKTSPQGSIIHIVRYELYQIATNELTNKNAGSASIEGSMFLISDPSAP